MNIVDDFKEAIINNDLESLKEIVTRNNINLTVDNNYALRWATKYNYHDMINFLLDNINDINYYIKKYILFKSAENNNFELFKRIYNSHVFYLHEEEYNHTNILLTHIDYQKNTNREFISFILNEIGDKINTHYLRDSYNIAFNNCNLELLDVFFEYKLNEIVRIDQSIEYFFENNQVIHNPTLSIEFIKVIEKHFNLETSYIRYYTLMINCVKNNIPKGALYLIEKYKTDNIPESALSILIQEILKSENIHLMRYFNVSSILNSQQFIIDICNDLSFQSSTDAILYIIDNIYLEESTKILILKQFLKYKSIETMSLIIPNLKLDLSFDNLFLVRNIFKQWGSIDNFDKWFLDYLLNDDKVYDEISDQWIKENIPESKREFILMEYKVRKF